MTSLWQNKLSNYYNDGKSSYRAGATVEKNSSYSTNTDGRCAAVRTVHSTPKFKKTITKHMCLSGFPIYICKVLTNQQFFWPIFMFATKLPNHILKKNFKEKKLILGNLI